MLRGGIADKWGNGYEARWTLLEALRVLQGLSDEIRIEPFNEDAGGLEFRANSRGRQAWHQCKRRRALGSWSIRALATEGVLESFARKLADPLVDCVFVSGDPAPDLKALGDKARLVGSAADFLDAVKLNQQETAALDALCVAWAVKPQVAYDGVRRVRIETVSDRQLDDHIEQFCNLFFTAAPEAAASRLLGYLDTQLTRTVTTEGLRAAVDSLGLGWRARFDPTAAERLRAATDDYLESLSPPVAVAEEATPELAAVRKAALDGPSRFVLVSGGAGGGKSLALAGAVREARARSWPVLALRIDRHLDARSLEDLGEDLLGRRENPVGVLGNRFGAEPCLLVLDQVDAVSEASGRSGRIRDLVFRMLRDTAIYPELRVIVACRVYDLDNDTRLKQLGLQDGVATIRLGPLDWERAVQPVLEGLGLDPAAFSERRRRILSSPINLKLFVTLAEAGATPQGDLSGAELFDALLDLRCRQLREAGVTWDPHAALAAMASWMSDRQALAAPKSVLSGFPNAAGALSSAGLVTAVGRQVQFAHESFFDHVFSAGFVARPERLLDLLRSDQQRLFRRTQVRQILARLRATTPSRIYLGELRTVLEADDVRYLVKDAVAAWLANLEDPTLAELALLEPWLLGDGPLHRFAHIVLVGRGWGHLLLECGALSRWIAVNGRPKETALWILQRNAVGHPQAVNNILRAWWGGKSDRLSDVLGWFNTLYPDGEIGVLEGFYAEVVAAVPNAEVKHRFRDNLDLDTWAHKGRERASRALGVWLARWLAAYPAEQPFGGFDSFDEHGVNELAQHAPVAFLNAVLPALAESVRRETRGMADGSVSYPTLRVPLSDDHHVLGSLAIAIERVARESGRRAAGLLGRLPTRGELALWLRLRAIAANGRVLGRGLPKLLGRPRVFELGYDAGWAPFADAARSALPHLDAPGRAAVEGAIMSHRPETDWASRCARDRGNPIPPRDDMEAHVRSDPYIVGQLRRSGEAERAILARIGTENLSPSARRRLAELDRKFVGRPARETSSGGGWVRSPIGPEQAARMSDAQWLKAMAKHADSSTRQFLVDEVIGGAEQLAHLLREQVKTEPARFVHLMALMPASANPAYPLAVLDGVREAEASPALALKALCEIGRWPQADCDRSASWLVQRIPGAARDAKVLAGLVNVAERGAASDTHVQTTNPTVPTDLEKLIKGGDLESSGINAERGSAWEALAAALWDDAGALEPVCALLERRIEAEPLASVRMCMMAAIYAVMGRDEARGLDLFRRAALKDLRSLLGRHGRMALNWSVVNRSQEIEGVVSALQATDDDALRALGFLQLAVLALLDPDREPNLRAVWRSNELARRAAALVAARNVEASRVADRAVSWLPEFFADRSPRVREEAGKIRWESLFDSSAWPELLVAYPSTPSFDDGAGMFLHALAKRVDDYPDIARVALKRLLARSDAEPPVRQRRSGLLEIGPILMALYRAAEDDPALEAELLDLFDLYLAGEHYGIREALGSYERD
ncbi:MAG: hypothetical protein Q8Q88_21975 [Phenylobacterium sp.]|uniref:hypothetical protein n=1 Tax=Phenylobacterium sp. TaxID=1871053 RepID=UPI0027333F02|nr:hypothetical protein [Phenylobacterium sp.]MDP3749708.1 hypothetical protein [Phenylobacterium sp.]